MANVKNWQPNMDLTERLWFEKCPKAVLFEIARQFGMRIADDFSQAGGLAALINEWNVLHAQGLVPQRPYDPTIDAAEIRAADARRAILPLA